MNNHGVPKRDLSQPVQFDGCYHIACFETHNLGAGNDLDFPLRRLQWHLELTCSSCKILLQDLQRYDRCPLAEVLCKKRDRSFLFLGRRSVVCVNQNVRVEEDEPVHLRSCSSSRLNFHPRELPCTARESRSNSAAFALA